ncbi:hypothetical protein BJV82DRAFT_635314 [Fennellomyces sp. T-0311]|nr:hypothetical protein BJV82DRAFT_635314 [Fennellomyces sp. T-0311]
MGDQAAPLPLFDGFVGPVRRVSRNSAVKKLLRDEYQFLRPQLRFIAEINATRRQDAMNLINLHVRRYLEGHFADFPPLSGQRIWTQAYKLVGLRLDEAIPRFDRPEVDLFATFEVFRECIRNQETGEAFYEPDTLDDGSLTATMADNFARQAIQNYHEHMRNLPRFIAIVWEQIIDGHHIGNANAVKRAARLITQSIIDHQPAPPQEFQDLDINDHYENMHIEFENWLGLEVPIQRLRARDLTADLCMRILGFSSSLLQFAELLGLPKRWSLLPIASHQVVHFTVCTRTLALILRRAWQQDHQNPLPQPLQREDGRALPVQGIYHVISDNNVKQVIWEAVFQMDHVKSNRFRLGDDLNNLVNVNPFTFDFSMTTDGVRAHLLFLRPTLAEPERFPTVRADLHRLEDNMDLGDWTKGVYLLDKDPRGLDQERLNESAIIGVDPGLSSMITASGTQEEGPGDHRLHEISVPTRSYHARTQVFWEYQKELQNRAKSGITAEYDMIRNHSSHVSSSAGFQGYIRVIAQIRPRMKDFAMHYKHREIRATLAAARQSTQAQITNELLGISPPRLPNAKIQFIHLTSKRQRKRASRRCRRDAQRNFGWERNPLPTISFWGDGRMPNIPGYAPIPHFGMIQFASRHMLVIITNEMYTSQVHAACDARLRAVNGMYHHCEHRYKRRRTTTGNGTRGRNVRWCVEENSAFLDRKSECDERQNRASEVWALKRCTNVDAHIHPVIVNRDTNAAKNMRRIGIAYMELDGHPDHRPPPLRLPLPNVNE